MASMIHRLQRIVQEVNRAPDIDHALVMITESLIRDLNADACTIYLASEDDPDVLVLKTCEGLNPEIIGKVELKLGQGLIGTIAERAEAMNLADASTHKNFILVQESGEIAFPILLGVPIITHRDVLGVIAVQRAENLFNEDEEAYLTTLAAQIATSIERAESKGRFSTEQATHMIKGVAGAPGMAIGEAMVLNRGVNLESVPDKKTSDIEGELTSFREAVRKVCAELTVQAEQMRASLPEEECALFIAYAQMLSGGSLIDDTEKNIAAGNWAPSSWRDTVEQHAYVFTQMEDRYLAERANDIRDLGLRVLRKLMLEQNLYIDFPEQTILVGDEVTATDLADVPLDCLSGIVSAHGSSSSHVAILAHALGIPAVMGVPNLPVKQLDGVKLIVDGYNGSAFVNPDKSVLDEYSQYLKKKRQSSRTCLDSRISPRLRSTNIRLPCWSIRG